MSRLASTFLFQPGYSALTKAAIQAKDGGFLLAGRLFEDSGKSSAFALRTRQDGTTAWSKTYSSEFSVFFTALAQIADGTFVAAGTFFYSDLAGDEDIWLVNLDANGEIIWQTAFGYKSSQNDGYAVAATPDGGFTLAGLNLPRGGRPATLVLKYDRERRLEWVRKYDGGIAYALTSVGDGGYALSGAHQIENSLYSNVYALRIDGAGGVIWEKTYPELEVYVLLESGIAITRRGNFAIAAKSVVMEIDGAGGIVWAHQDGDLALGTVAALPDGSLAVGGSLIVNYEDHAYVAVLGRAGEKILWDNTEILDPSSLAQIFVSSGGLIAGGGSAPLGADRSQAFLAVFEDVKEVVPAS